MCLLGSYRRAEKDATDAEENDPGSAKALFRRAQARRHLGKLDEAEAGKYLINIFYPVDTRRLWTIAES